MDRWTSINFNTFSSSSSSSTVHLRPAINMHLLLSMHSPTTTTAALSHRLMPQQCTQLKRLHTSSQAFPSCTSSNKLFSDSRSLIQLPSSRAPESAVKSSSAVVEAAPTAVDEKDQNIVFVAGATGKVGSRLVRELLKLGCSVRAGVRSAQRAEPLVQSVRQMNLDGSSAVLSQPIERLEIVECDLEAKDLILPALGKASVVVCCIGASEKEIFDVTGPYRIDYQATKNLIDSATVAKVNHFILLTSLGTNKFGLPAAILNLFWGVLCWKRKAEEALLASGLPYTIVRPGGMERPTDAYKETHNIALSQEDTLFGGQVSNLQVAELMAFIATHPGLSYGKIVEVIAETTAPLTPIQELLANIPAKSIFKVPGDAAVPETISPTTPRTTIEEVPAQAKPTAATTPLSPYIAYEDLKPPTSPSPTPSTGSTGIHASGVGTIQTATVPSPPAVAEPSDLSTAEARKATKSYLSPYASYEDLKPPSSPCPTPSSGSTSNGSIDTQLIGGNGAAEISKDKDTPVADKPSDDAAKSKATPLSPFTMYEDLKPPSSPTPSLRN